MRKTMPPLRALVAFEASVRHASFKEAARELAITPGAISQQVQKLEQWLGYPLFIRQVRQLQVTDQAMGYYAAIAPALEQISQASTNYKDQNSNTVQLSLSPTLAAKWLGPRLSDFVSQHPNIEVHINATLVPVDFHHEPADLAIRHYDGHDPSLESQLMYADEVRLFCSPDYLKKHPLNKPEDVAGATLLNTSMHHHWEEWLEQFTTLPEVKRDAIPRMHFDQALLAIDAARRGQGLTLSNEILTCPEAQNGELIEPFDLRLSSRKSYYLVHPKNRTLSKASKALKDWLLEQVAG